MLVSIIVPVYNVEKYLRQCLDSILNQSYKDIEIVLVNDGSTDESGQICDNYAAKYRNIKVLHKKNAGLGMARNTGLDYISGEYVTFVDSDDYLDSVFIEKLVNEIVNKQVYMCKAGFRKVYDNGKAIFERKYKDEIFPDGSAKVELLPRMIGSSPSQHDSVEMCVCGTIYKVAPIVEHHLRFVSERKLISEDMVFNIDYVQYAKGACLISECGYNYRTNPSSLTKTYREDRFSATQFFYIEVRKKLEYLGYSQDTFLRLDRMFFIYLKLCISQEKKKVSHHSAHQSRVNIKEICSNQIVQNIIKGYPVNCMGIKQRVFIELLRHEAATVLYVLGQLGLI